MVTETLKSDSSYQAIFNEMQNTSRPSWLERLQRTAFERFEEIGFPSVRDEEWKYTNVAPLSKINFNPNGATSSAIPDVTQFANTEANKSQLIFVNGILRQDLSDLSAVAADVVLLDLAAAVNDEKYAEIVRAQLGRTADHVSNGFVALNTALLNTGAFLYLPKKKNIETPIHLLFLTDSSQENLITSPRVLVVAEESSSATLIESYASARDEIYFTNAVVEVVMNENARLEHYKVQRDGHGAFHIATTAVTLARNSCYNTTTITLGAQLSRHDIRVSLDDEGAECSVDGLYIVSTGQHTDTHSVIDHRKPHCTSRQLYKGILDGKSRAVFNGKIFVRLDAQKTDAMQTNKNLLLSNEARVDTKPQLEILADDVKCAHGAAVGQLDEDELFYLATRGIHHDLAKNLLTYGFAEEVIGKIKVDSIRAQLDEAVLNRLNARLEV
jgi:Fe-S cluster assembly protein SufD